MSIFDQAKQIIKNLEQKATSISSTLQPAYNTLSNLGNQLSAPIAAPARNLYGDIIHAPVVPQNAVNYISSVKSRLPSPQPLFNGYRALNNLGNTLSQPVVNSINSIPQAFNNLNYNSGAGQLGTKLSQGFQNNILNPSLAPLGQALNETKGMPLVNPLWNQNIKQWLPNLQNQNRVSGDIAMAGLNVIPNLVQNSLSQVPQFQHGAGSSVPVLGGLAAGLINPLGDAAKADTASTQLARDGEAILKNMSAKDRLSHLVNYGEGLLSKGFSKFQVDNIGAKQAAAILDKNITPEVWASKYAPSILPKASQEVVNTAKGVSADLTKPATTANPNLNWLQDVTNEVRRIKDPLQTSQTLDQAIKTVDVKNKVNLIDYIRTPENVMNKIGLGPQAQELRGAYDKYLSELPKEIQKITDWSKRVGPGSEVSIFKSLDGQPVTLNPAEQQVAGEIKQYLAGWADKLGLPQDARVSNYITHIFQRGSITKEFDPELAKIIKDQVPGSVYDPFLLQRKGKQDYIENAWLALDAYTKRAVRKANLDPVLEKISSASKSLDGETFDYVKRYIGSVNMRPNSVDILIDNTIKSSPIGYKFGQRPLTVLTQRARQMVFRGLLGLNPVSALKNLSQGANTYAKLGEKYTVVGYAKVAQNLPRFLAGIDTELNQVGVLNSNLIEDRTISATKSFWQKADPVLFSLFNLAEKINRGAAYWGGKSQGLAQGMSEQEAINYGKKVVADTQFLFSRIDTPVALSSDIAKTLGQFQSYSLKQSEFLAGMVKNRNIAGLVRYTAATFLFYATVGQAIGMKPQDLIPSFRVGVPPTAQAGLGAAQVALGTPDQYGNPANPDLFKRATTNPNLIKGLMNYIPAGGQIQRTIGGLGNVSRGYAQTSSGNIKYPVQQNVSNYVQGGLFGANNLPEAQTYFNNLGQSKAQVIYDEINKLQTPQEKTQAWNALVKKGIITKDNASEVKQYFTDQSLGVTDYERQIKNQGVADGARAKSVYQEINKLNSPQEKTALWTKYVQAKIITPEVAIQLHSLFSKKNQ